MVNNTTQNALKVTNFISKFQKNFHRPQPLSGRSLPRTTQPRRRSLSAFGTLILSPSALKLWRAPEQKFTTTLLTVTA